MSSTLTVAGTMTMPNAPGGSTTPVLIGTPTTLPTSTTGPQLTYYEKTKFEYRIAAGAVQTVNFGSLTDGDFLYIGVDEAITYKLNGGSDVFALAAEGFVMIMGGSITALELTAGVVDVGEAVVIILGT